MSLIPTSGVLGSAAGAPLSQSTGAAGGSAAKEAAALERRLATDEKAEQAGGIGETEEDEQADERDADGRRLWERRGKAASSTDENDDSTPLSKDTTGAAGNSLDLVG